MGTEMQRRCVIISSAPEPARLPDHPLSIPDALVSTQKPSLPPHSSVTHWCPAPNPPPRPRAPFSRSSITGKLLHQPCSSSAHFQTLMLKTTNAGFAQVVGFREEPSELGEASVQPEEAGPLCFPSQASRERKSNPPDGLVAPHFMRTQQGKTRSHT